MQLFKVTVLVSYLVSVALFCYVLMTVVYMVALCRALVRRSGPLFERQTKLVFDLVTVVVRIGLLVLSWACMLTMTRCVLSWLVVVCLRLR